MQYFTTCNECRKLQLLDTDDYGSPIEGIGCEVEFELPDDEQLDSSELCSCGA